MWKYIICGTFISKETGMYDIEIPTSINENLQKLEQQNSNIFCDFEYDKTIGEIVLSLKKKENNEIKIIISMQESYFYDHGGRIRKFINGAQKKNTISFADITADSKYRFIDIFPSIKDGENIEIDENSYRIASVA